MSKHILCVSELGAGAGHIAPLVKVAQAMLAQDPSLAISFAVQNPSMAYAMFGESGFEFLPSPYHPPDGAGQSRTGSYSEILGHFGYLRKDLLSTVLRSWDGLLASIKPDVILADHSPTACLAARGRYPVALIGNGFTVPPCDMTEFPAFRLGMSAPQMQPMMRDVINKLLNQRAQPELPTLPALLATELRGVFAVPQTDPYGRLRKDPLLGSYNGAITPLPAKEDGSVFLYCGLQIEQLAQIVEATLELGRPVEAFVGPYNSPAQQLLLGFGAKVHLTTPNLQEMLSQSNMVVHTAGAGLAQAALQAGRPQLCLPIHLESRMTATGMRDLNVALSVDMSTDENKLSDAMRAVSEVQSFTRNAQAVAHDIARLPLPKDPAAHFGAQVLAL